MPYISADDYSSWGYQDAMNGNTWHEPRWIGSDRGWQYHAYMRGRGRALDQLDRAKPSIERAVVLLNPPSTQETNMTEFPVESGVLIPDPKRQGAKYPWRELEVGQSFFIPDTIIKPTSASSLCSTANAKHSPKRFVWRMDEKEPGVIPTTKGARIWRVK